MDFSANMVSVTPEVFKTHLRGFSVSEYVMRDGRVVYRCKYTNIVIGKYNPNTSDYLIPESFAAPAPTWRIN